MAARPLRPKCYPLDQRAHTAKTPSLFSHPLILRIGDVLLVSRRLELPARSQGGALAAIFLALDIPFAALEAEDQDFMVPPIEPVRRKKSRRKALLISEFLNDLGHGDAVSDPELSHARSLFLLLRDHCRAGPEKIFVESRERTGRELRQ
jgi:hypothetical protein